MKKIFAIALAVVMVLSMASAFAASDCYVWGTNWDCAADELWCGKGSVEVVPYVKVNTACGWEYQVSECASAIRSENVYFAIKLTVEEYPDPEWWAAASMDFETTGLALNWDVEDVVNFAGIDWDADEEKVYYNLVSGAGWIDVEDDAFELDNTVVFGTQVNPDDDVCSNEDYDVCVTLKSYFDGFGNGVAMQLGDYTVRVVRDSALTWATTFNADGEFTGSIEITGSEADESVTLWVVDGVIEGDYRLNNAFYNKVMADFGFVNCGTAACVTKKNFEKNFGWDFEQKDCFSWSTKGASVVDTDCVVAIPKTGDASVLAWLF